MCFLKDICLRVFIYGYDIFRAGTATHMLAGTRESYSNVEVRSNNLTGKPYLPSVWHPVIIARRSGGAYCPIQYLS